MSVQSIVDSYYKATGNSAGVSSDVQNIVSSYNKASLLPKKTTKKTVQKPKKITKNITIKKVTPTKAIEKTQSATIKTKPQPKQQTIKIKPGQTKVEKKQLKKLNLFKEPKVADQSAMLSKQTKKYIRERPAQRDKQVAKEIEKATRTQLKKGYQEPGFGGQLVESFKQSAASNLSSLGATAEMIGNMTGMMLVSDAGAKMRERWSKVVVSNPEWNEPVEGLSYKDPRKYARLLGGAVPSVLGAIATGFVATVASGGNPIVGTGATIAYGFGLEGGSTYDEAKKAGVSEEEAQKWGVLVGTANGILEAIFPTKFLKGKNVIKPSVIKKITTSLAKNILNEAKKIGVKVAENGIIEGSTEAVQQVISNAVAKNYEKNRRLWDGVVDSFLGGLLSGGLIGPFEGDSDVNIQPKTELKDKLPEGETTPQEVIGAVIGSGQEKTKEGKAIIREATQAQKEGKNIVIEKTKPEKVAKAPLDDISALAKEARKYKSAEEFVKGQERTNRLGHSAPSGKGETLSERLDYDGDVTLREELSGHYKQPADYFHGYTGPKAYGYDSFYGKETLNAIKNAKETGEITIYRAVPKDVKKIDDGDWVYFIKEQADIHGKEHMGGKPYKIISQKASIDDVWWDGNDIREWGYDSGKTKSQLTDIWNKANTPPPAKTKVGESGGEVVTPKEKPVIKPKTVSVPREQLPVGEGKEKVSRLEARVKQTLDNLTPGQVEQLGLSKYKQLNNKETIRKASEFVSQNPDKALQVLMGKENPPEGLPIDAIFVAMANNSTDNMELAIKLASLRATRYGQEIQILKELIPNSNVKLLSDIAKMKEQGVAERFNIKGISEVIRKRTEAVVNRTRRTLRKKLARTNWDAFINSIETC